MLETLAAPTFNFKTLDFTKNCTNAAEFNRLYFWGTQQIFIQTYDALHRYVLGALPGSSPANDTPSKSEVMTWFEGVYQTESVVYHMYRRPFDKCLTQTCQAIHYPGNPDIAGLGMLAAYAIEAAMATTYLLGRLLPLILPKVEQGTRQQRHPYPREEGNPLADLVRLRLRDAVETTINDFLDTALVFAFSVVVAGLTIIPTSLKTYDMLQCTLVASFSISAVLVVWALQKESMRRDLLRNCFFAGVIVLAFIEMGLVVWTERGYEYVTRRENCLPEVFKPGQAYKAPSRYFVTVQALTGLAALLVLLLMAFSLLSTSPALSAATAGSPLVRWASRLPWDWFVCAYGFLNLWLSLGALLYVRHLVGKRIGISPEESSWGFGQVMALATWLPTQVSFADVFFRGAETALQERVPPPWKVVNEHSSHLLGRGTHSRDSTEEEGIMLQDIPCYVGR